MFDRKKEAEGKKTRRKLLSIPENQNKQEEDKVWFQKQKRHGREGEREGGGEGVRTKGKSVCWSSQSPSLLLSSQQMSRKRERERGAGRTQRRTEHEEAAVDLKTGKNPESSSSFYTEKQKVLVSFYQVMRSWFWIKLILGHLGHFCSFQRERERERELNVKRSRWNYCSRVKDVSLVGEIISKCSKG